MRSMRRKRQSVYLERHFEAEQHEHGHPSMSWCSKVPSPKRTRAAEAMETQIASCMR
jgi:hypothetical protein